jgi:predicted Zn-dependent protease
MKAPPDPAAVTTAVAIEPARATLGMALALAAALAFGSGLLSCATAAAAQPDGGGQGDTELQLGQEVYDELRQKGEIVATSPLYEQLRPIAERITRAAQPRYEHPFRFYLVHQTQPNAFSTPGGNVYVADSLLYFVKNTEELAGTLCHEVAHTIHHDTMTLMEKRQRLAMREVGAGVIVGPTPAHILALALIGKLNSLGYSRDVESRADVTGSDICAEAQYNPWGLVWLFSDFKDAKMGEGPELLSDHPSDEHRVRTLKEHFRQNPETFARFDSDPGSAMPIRVPAEMAETFVR